MKPTAVGTYIFAGGFTLGVRKYFNVLAHLEQSNFGVETVRANMPKLPIYVDKAAKWPLALDALRGQSIDFLYGNPPCAPWSNAAHGYKKKLNGTAATAYLRDPRTSCVWNYFALLKELRPKVWAWESVTQAVKKGWPMVRELTEQAAELGYSATYVLHNAADLGVPQDRKRVFIIFHNVKMHWLYPKQALPTTVRDVIGDLDEGEDPVMTPLPPARKAFAPFVDEGGSFRRTWEKMQAEDPELMPRDPNGRVMGRHPFCLRRLSWDKPSATLMGGSGVHLVHPTEDRYLTVLEAQLLCSFPSDYVFTGSVTDRYRQQAQGVTPGVGTWLARNVRRAIDRSEPLELQLPTTLNFLAGLRIEHDPEGDVVSAIA